MHPYTTYLTCFLLGLFVTLVLTPQVARLAVRVGALDRPVNCRLPIIFPQ
jgi:tellurite resistance protein TehA-like permease